MDFKLCIAVLMSTGLHVLWIGLWSKYLLVILTCFLIRLWGCTVSDCLHYYKTPALDNQFTNFPITTSIPSDGINGSESIQEALSFSTYNRRYVTFTFKGKGHALLRFLFKRIFLHFKVEIGGGASHNEVSIYLGNTIYKKNSTTLINITSECAYRSFYIHKKNLNTTTRVYVGLGSDPRRNHVLYADFTVSAMRDDIDHILISTASDCKGEWQFASAGQMFGGCGNGTVCSNNSLDLECHNDDESKGNGLFGTCTPEFDDFSTVTFGNGTFRKGTQNTTRSNVRGTTMRSGSLVATIDRKLSMLVVLYCEAAILVQFRHG